MASKNPSGKGGFKDHPENRNKKGQRNSAAVAFSRTLRELLVKEGERTLSVEGKKHKKVELLIRRVWSEALQGKEWAVIYISERVEGKVKEQVELSGEIAVKGYINVSPDDWDESKAD